MLTELNYYEKNANTDYMSVSQFKDFIGIPAKAGCEFGALKKLKREWVQEKTTPLLVGSYVDRYFEGTLEEFKNEEPEMFTMKGELKAPFKKAEEIIKRIERDELFLKFMSGEKQVIMTGNIAGYEWKAKMDSYIPNVAIVDLKVVKSIREQQWIRDVGYLDFIRAWGYDIQGAVYQEIVYQNTGERLPFYLACASKEKEVDIEIIQITQPYLNDALSIVEANAHRVYHLKNGIEKPIRCEHCDICKHFKKLKTPISITELMI